ncbi:MAG: FtsW/RodA/SpoVE family cell cycle protein [Bacilli bacterium]
MKKKPLRRVDKSLLIVTVLLFIIGLVMIFSASNVTAYIKQGDSPYIYFIKQAIFLVGGSILFIIFIHTDTKKYKKIFGFLFYITIILLGILLVHGKATNGATSWFSILGFGLQPSEFFKVFSIIWLATYYESKKGSLNNYVSCLYPIFMCGVGAILIFLQPDLGTFLIYAGIVSLVFFAIPMSKEIKQKVFMLALGMIAVFSIVLLTAGKSIINETQMARITEFSNPCSKFITSGNQVCNGYIAINNGGLFGVGLGNSTQKYLYLPEPYTDFIFAIIMEELGLIVSIGIIILLMFVIYRVIMIGRKSYTDRGATICYGVAIYIFLHILINLGGLFGLMPLTGVPLPFLSYGGSYTISLVIALIAVQRVHIETKMYEEELLKKQNQF